MKISLHQRESYRYFLLIFASLFYASYVSFLRFPRTLRVKIPRVTIVFYSIRANSS